MPGRDRAERRRQDDDDTHVPWPGAPDAGTIEAFGLPIPGRVREAKQRIGVVTQFDSLDPDFTCAENLRVYGHYFGLAKQVIDERVPRLLEFAALQSKTHAIPAELSGGMKRRLSLGARSSTTPTCCSWTSRPPASIRRLVT